MMLPLRSEWEEVMIIASETSSSWVRLTGNLIFKHMPKVEATVKDHLDQEKKNPVHQAPCPPRLP